MLLARLTENHARLKQLPEKFREQLLQDNGVAKVPSEWVTMLMETGGDLQALSAQFMAKQEQENESRQSQKTWWCHWLPHLADSTRSSDYLMVDLHRCVPTAEP